MVQGVTRDKFVKGEDLKIKLKKFVEDFKKKNGRPPSVMEIAEGAAASTLSVKKYLKKGVDYTALTKAEAAVLGGTKKGEAIKNPITKVSEKLKDKINNLKLRGLNARLETSKAGGQFIRLRATSQDLIKALGKNTRGGAIFSGPATEQNYKKVKKLIGEIKNSDIYKKVIKPFKSSEQKLAEKKGKYYAIKEGDPRDVYKKISREISEKGVTEIHHSRYKKFPQSTNVLMAVDPQINNLKSLKDAEEIRNKLITEQKRILNPRSKLNFEDKKRNLEMINAKLTKLKNSLRGTEGAGLLDVRLITLDETGKPIIKDRGADFSKALGFKTPEGNIDLTKIDKVTAREIVNNTVENYTAKIKALPEFCRPIVAAAIGGRIETCEAIIKANPKLAAEKVSKVITATKGPLKDLKDSSQEIIKLAETGQIKIASDIPRPDDAKLADTFKETNLRWNNDIGAFVTPNEDIASQADIKKYAADNPMEVKAGETPLKPATNKSVLSNVGKALARVGAPLPTALIDSYFIGQQVKEGKGTAEIASNPLNWLGLATMEPLSKAAGIAEGGGLNKALRLGLNPATIRGITRFAGLPGLAISTALTAYDQYQKYKDGEGFIFNLLNQKGTE